MVVMAREAWTDNRLDDLNQRVTNLDRRMEAGFAEMRAEFRAMRTEMAEFRAQTQTEFAAQHRATVQLFGGMIVALIVGFLGTIATILTQV